MDLSKKDGGLPPDSVVQTIDDILYDSERLFKKYHNPQEFSMRQLALAPCSPFSVTGDLMKESAVLARKVVVKEGKLTTLDEEKLVSDANTAVDKLINNM